MNTTTNVTNGLTDNRREPYTIGSVISADGTTIGYRQFGHGPGLILLHGAASSGYNHLQLAEQLATAFTVYVPDRRGRGLSGPNGLDYSIQKDIEDMDALLTKTGAHQVFGVSSGGIIWLQAALTLPTIHKAAIYEPPFIVNDSLSTAFMARYEQEMAQGKGDEALITGMKGAQMGPLIFNVMPRFLLKALFNMGAKQEKQNGQETYVPMKELAPTLHYDFQLVVQMSEKLERFMEVHAEVLLLGGSKSPSYLKVALSTLEHVLPHVTRVEFAGLGHAASWNTDRGGHPGPVAQALHRFFIAS